VAYKIKDEPFQLASVLRGMVECGPAPDDLWIRDQPDGDPFVVRAAELLEEQEVQLELLTRMADSLGSQLARLKEKSST
jgi:hypothetical protein